MMEIREPNLQSIVDEKTTAMYSHSNSRTWAASHRYVPPTPTKAPQPLTLNELLHDLMMPVSVP